MREIEREIAYIAPSRRGEKATVTKWRWAGTELLLARLLLSPPVPGGTVLVTGLACLPTLFFSQEPVPRQPVPFPEFQ